MKMLFHIAVTFTLVGALIGSGAVKAQENYADLSPEQAYVLILQKIDSEAQLNEEFRDYTRLEIEALRLEIRQLKEDTTTEARQLREDTTTEARQLREDTTTEARQLREDTKAEVRQLREETTAEARQLREDTRQFREESRSDIRELRGWFIGLLVAIVVGVFAILGGVFGIVYWAFKIVLADIIKPTDAASFGVAEKGAASYTTEQASHLRE